MTAVWSWILDKIIAFIWAKLTSWVIDHVMAVVDRVKQNISDKQKAQELKNALGPNKSLSERIEEVEKIFNS